MVLTEQEAEMQRENLINAPGGKKAKQNKPKKPNQTVDRQMYSFSVK